jgi:hypothetical protein
VDVFELRHRLVSDYAPNGSLPPKSNFVLHHGSALQHETTLSNSNTPRSSARYAPVRLVRKQILSSSLIHDSFHNTVSP